MGILPDWHVASLAAAALVDGVTDAVLLLKGQTHKILIKYCSSPKGTDTQDSIWADAVLLLKGQTHKIPFEQMLFFS